MDRRFKLVLGAGSFCGLCVGGHIGRESEWKAAIDSIVGNWAVPGGRRPIPDLRQHRQADLSTRRDAIRARCAHALHHAQANYDRAALQAVIEIKGPKGDTVASGPVTPGSQGQLPECVYGFSWPIPPSQAGGEYTIRMSYPYTGQPPAERKFDVRAYRAPRLRHKSSSYAMVTAPETRWSRCSMPSGPKGACPAGPPSRLSPGSMAPNISRSCTNRRPRKLPGPLQASARDPPR